MLTSSQSQLPLNRLLFYPGDLPGKASRAHSAWHRVGPFAAGHIPGAINGPLAELERWRRGAPKNKQIIAYCRGPCCLMAFEAVARLRRKGYKAQRLADGFPEWKSAGLPVEF